MVSDAVGAINLLLAVHTHADPDAETCEREADELEARAYAKRLEAFRLRAIARAALRGGADVA